MMSGNTTRRDLILNPYFIAGLALLLINDFYLKAAFGNLVTGKLSDFAGLLIFPMFLAAIWPRAGKYASLITAVGFIFWKTPAADPVIGFINSLNLLQVARVVDYSDYVALPVLLLSHYLITRRDVRAIDPGKLAFIPKVSLLVASFFAFCATSTMRIVPISQAEDLPGTVAINKTYRIKLPPDSVINRIKALGYNCDLHHDTVWHNSNPGRVWEYYQTDEIVRTELPTSKSDTIINVKYRFLEVKPGKTDIVILNVTLHRKDPIQDWKLLKHMSKVYEEVLEQKLVDKIDPRQ